MLCLEPREVFDEAIVGVLQRPLLSDTVAIYDREKVIDAMVDSMGMEDRDEAEEYFEYNTIGAYMGEETPVYLITGDDAEMYIEMVAECGDESESENLINTKSQYKGLKMAGIYLAFGGESGIVYQRDDVIMLNKDLLDQVATIDSSEEAMAVFSAGKAKKPGF